MTVRKQHPPLKNNKIFFLILGVPIIFWAFAFPFIKIGLEELSPANLTIMRLFFVCVIFLLIMVVAPKKFTKIQKKDLLPLFLLGFTGLVVYHFGLNYGEQYMSASAASLIIATIPVLMVILAAIFLKENITKTIVIGIILSFIGVVIISLWGTENASLEIEYLLAACAVFIAALVGAVYSIAGKKLLERYSPLSLTVYAFLFGSLGLIPLLSPSLITQVSSLSLKGWGAVLFLVIFPTVIGYVLWYVALQKRPTSEVGASLYFVPVLSTIFSYFLINESITWMFIVGGFFVILGLILVNKHGV